MDVPFAVLGVWQQAALVGGLWLLATAYLLQLLAWQGDRYGVWYDAPSEAE